MKLTSEEKARWEPMLWQVWGTIGQDVEHFLDEYGVRNRVSTVVEFVTDAHRPIEYGGMTREEYEVLCKAYHTRAGMKWLRDLMRNW